MLNNKFINELKNVLRHRGEIPTVQIEYAKVEEKVIIQMYPIIKPYEEVRSPKLRNLKSYIGEHALNMIVESRRALV
jgi:hypothetical protein